MILYGGFSRKLRGGGVFIHLFLLRLAEKKKPNPEENFKNKVFFE